MKVLLLHPEDTLPIRNSEDRWDLVVDLGRAPSATYEQWRRQASCEVVSLYRAAEEVDDLRHLRDLLRLGIGVMVDNSGIDWWDLLCLFIAGELQQLTLIRRLPRELQAGCQLYASRPHALASALQKLLGARLTVLESRFQSVIRRARHCHDVISYLDADQLAQVVEDKFDGRHLVRRRFTSRPKTAGPVILLPSAYVNVSRTALSYAKLLPDHQFLLVLTRSSGTIRPLPPNVRSTSLSPYFVARDKREIAFLTESWKNLRKQLVASAEEYKAADAEGILERIPPLLPWGIALRDAWKQVFESENVAACLSADDSNAPSSIPLLMAQQRGLPALAAHHGALDSTMAIKVNHADAYLVKNEMEHDYLQRICQVAPERIVIAPPASSKSWPLRIATRHSAPWLVFFTEPYQNYGWRRDEVYRDLLPRLCALARACGLKLVFKLHPFESIRGHRKMLHRLLPEQEHQIEVMAGAPSNQLWNNTQFALTVQSSTALECSARGIPVFLCTWLRDAYSGYVQQFTRFGVGHGVASPEQIAEIPQLLGSLSQWPAQPQVARRPVDSNTLADLFLGTYSLPVASNG